ncbi:MAG: FGGY-family carbohydrate kinase, partial [Sphingomonadales bacterium]
AIFGLTRDSGPEHLARAALESVAYQTFDLLQAFEKDSGQKADPIRVDGGMVANDWFVQFLADILDTGIERPKVQETTALGAAFLAGLGAGVYKDLSEISNFWHLDRRFQPDLTKAKRENLLSGWHDAISRVKTSE